MYRGVYMYINYNIIHKTKCVYSVHISVCTYVLLQSLIRCEKGPADGLLQSYVLYEITSRGAHCGYLVCGACPTSQVWCAPHVRFYPLLLLLLLLLLIFLLLLLLLLLPLQYRLSTCTCTCTFIWGPKGVSRSQQ